MTHIDKNTTFWGYRRENGRVGVRNHVIILPLDDLSNSAAEAVAHAVKGTMAVPHPYGRLQFGADLELHFRTLIGAGSNPNVAAVVVIGIEDSWTKTVVDGIAATGKPVVGFGIEGHGDHETIMRASKAAKNMVHHATSLHRVECPISDLGFRPNVVNLTPLQVAAPTQRWAMPLTNSIVWGRLWCLAKPPS